MGLALHIVAFILWYSFVIVVGAALICLALSPLVLAVKLISTALAILYFFAIGVLCVVTLPITFILRLRSRNVRTFYRWYHERRHGGESSQTFQSERFSREQEQRPSSHETLNRQETGDPSDPYRILGVPRDVSQEALTQAYRQKMQMNHPDKVATLDPALQAFATERAQLITRAYKEIGRNR